MAFEIIRDDITKVKADVIVNTANPKPIYGSGVDKAIYKAAGMNELLEARKKIGDIQRGEAFVTPAFKLNAKYIVHTVGPVWKDGNHGEFEILKCCYENSLKLAWDLQCDSIAFPLISSGVYGFPKDKALQIALNVIQAFVMDHDIRVILVVFDKKSFELSGTVVNHIREYVDANYVEKAHVEEYADQYRYSESQRNRWDFFSKPRNKETVSSSKNNSPLEMVESNSVPSFVNIDELLKTSQKTFQEKLFEIIDERGLTGPEVYKNYITKQVYSKIQCNKDYHPTKYTALALCLSLHLDIVQTQDLIGRAGYSLSPSSKTDIIVKGCIINKEYNIVNINCMLFEYDCPLLEKIK